MNIFVTDTSPVASATYQHDQHLRKMILETAQIIDGGTRPWMNLVYGSGDYEIVKIPKSHLNNATIHSAADPVVLRWCMSHFNALLSEFTYRWGRTHSYGQPAVYDPLRERYAQIYQHLTCDRGFRLAMDDQDRADCPLYTRDLDTVVSAYRRYYVRTKLVYGKKLLPCTWTHRDPPRWLTQMNNALAVNVRSPDVKTLEPAYAH